MSQISDLQVQLAEALDRLVMAGVDGQRGAEEAVQPHYSNVNYTHADFDQAAAAAETADPEAIALAVQHSPQADEGGQQPIRRFGQKIGRNDPCPCGSGKKSKKCCGK